MLFVYGASNQGFRRARMAPKARNSIVRYVLWLLMITVLSGNMLKRLASPPCFWSANFLKMYWNCSLNRVGPVIHPRNDPCLKRG